MSARLGRPFMPWQTLVSNVAGEVLPNGRMAYPVVVLIVPRRAGKTAMDLARKMQRAASQPGSRCWYTAQTGGDAESTFREDMAPLIQDAFSKDVAKVRLSNGSMGVTLPGKRSTVRVFAPTEKGLHGKDSDDVTVDEAWAFARDKGALLEAGLRPTGATRAQRQLWIVSAGGTHESTWLLDWRELGRALTGPDQGIAFFEWHPPVDAEGRVDADLDDPAVWAATHPAIGHTIPLEALVEDYASSKSKPGGLELFYRSYLDIFTGAATGRIIPDLAWKDRRDPAAAIDPQLPIQLAYDVAEDRAHGAVTISQLQGGRVVTEVISATGVPDNDGDPPRQGIAWMADRVHQLRHAFPHVQVAADSFGPARTVTRALVELGVEVHELDTGDMVEAAAELLDDILGGGLVHRGQRVLDDAAGAIAKRQLGDSWAWSRRMSTANVAPVLALTISHWRARHFVAGAPSIYLGEAS
jgi:hypothetical protein